MAQVLQTAQQQPAAQYPNTGVQQQQQRFTWCAGRLEFFLTNCNWKNDV
jgi:hypothetical protein